MFADQPFPPVAGHGDPDATADHEAEPGGGVVVPREDEQISVGTAHARALPANPLKLHRVGQPAQSAQAHADNYFL